MQVKDLMSFNVVSAKPEMLITDVATLLHEHSFSGLPVVDDTNTVLGMITERDFLTSKSNIYLPTYIKMLNETDFVQGGGKNLPYAADQIARAKASDIMNKQISFAHPEMSVEEVAEIFASRGANPLAVTDAHNKLVGIIARSDMLKPMIRHATPLADEHARSKQAQTFERPIDEQVLYISKDFQSKFAYVAKARANIWLTAVIVLFVVGFLAGIIYVADPSIIVKQESVKNR